MSHSLAHAHMKKLITQQYCTATSIHTTASDSQSYIISSSPQALQSWNIVHIKDGIHHSKEWNHIQQMQGVSVNTFMEVQNES